MLKGCYSALQPFEHGCRWAALASSQQALASIASWRSTRLSAASLLRVSISFNITLTNLCAEGKTLPVNMRRYHRPMLLSSRCARNTVTERTELCYPVKPVGGVW